MVNTRPYWAPYAVASAAAAAVLLLLYYYSLLLGRVEPRVTAVAGLPVVYDRETLAFTAALIVAAALPVYVYARRAYSWAQSLREQTRDFLLIFSGLVEGTESVYEALMIGSRMVGRPLSVMVEYMARLYKLTGSIERAFEEAFKGAPRDVRLLLSTIVLAARGGGRMEEVISQAASFANELRRFGILVESRLAEYTAIVALSSITFSFAAAVIVKLLQALGAATLPFMRAAMPPIEVLQALFYYTMLIITLFSSIVVGKVIRGYAPLAAKYVAILVPVNTVVLLYLPDIIPG